MGTGVATLASGCWRPEMSRGSCAGLCPGLSTLQPQSHGWSCPALGLLLPRSPSRGRFPQLKHMFGRSSAHLEPLPSLQRTHLSCVPCSAACICLESPGLPWCPGTPLGFDRGSQRCSVVRFSSGLSPAHQQRAEPRWQVPQQTPCDCPGRSFCDSQGMCAGERQGGFEVLAGVR